MPHVDFLLTNPGHHSAMLLPVMRTLNSRGHRCRLLSLSELRGFVSPSSRFHEEGFETVRIIPFSWRPSPSFGGSTGGSAPHPSRTAAQKLVWRLLLRPRLSHVARSRAQAVVLPNDGAFPFDKICAYFRALGVPVVVVQEGLRFDRPAGTRDGTGGANAYAVWGPSSRSYYLDQGATPDRVAETGNPRFDVIDATDWAPAARAAAARFGLTSNTLLFLSNPIDDLGFVSTDQKIELFRRFAEGISPLMSDPSFRLAVRLHGRESPRAFEEAARGLPCSDHIVITRDAELYPLIAASRAAVMFGSTAGLEVLLFGKPLALLEIPGFGYIHDFVDSGAARGLAWTSPINDQVADWMSAFDIESRSIEVFLDSTVTNRGRSSVAVAEVIERMLAPEPVSDAQTRRGA